MCRTTLHVPLRAIAKCFIYLHFPWTHGTIDQVLLEEVETYLVECETEVIEDDVRLVADLNSGEIVVQLEEGNFVRCAVAEDLVVLDVDVGQIQIQKEAAQIDVKNDVVEKVDFIWSYNAVENVVGEEVEFVEFNLNVVWAENERLIVEQGSKPVGNYVDAIGADVEPVFSDDLHRWVDYLEEV